MRSSEIQKGPSVSDRPRAAFDELFASVAPEPQPSPPKPPDRLLPGVLLQYTFNDGRTVDNLSLIDRKLMDFSHGNYTRTHPHDERGSTFHWSPYNWRSTR